MITHFNNDNCNIIDNFSALPWRISSETKAEQVAKAVSIVFNSQAFAFHGGDGWFVLVENSDALKSEDGAERLDILFSLLEMFDVSLAGDYLIEPLPLPHDDDEQEEAAIRDIVYRFEHTINLERRIEEVLAKLDGIDGNHSGDLMGKELSDIRRAANVEI